MGESMRIDLWAYCLELKKRAEFIKRRVEFFEDMKRSLPVSAHAVANEMLKTLREEQEFLEKSYTQLYVEPMPPINPTEKVAIR